MGTARPDIIVDVGDSDVSMSVSVMLATVRKESLEKSKDDPVPFYKFTKKHPCMYLRELSDDVSYTYQDCSPLFPIGTFTCTVHVNGVEFTHNAATKKQARCYAATEALIQMFGYVWNPCAESDDEEAPTPSVTLSEGEGMAVGVGKRLRVGGSQAPKNALVHLHEMKPGLVFQMESQTGPDHVPIFTMSVMLDGEKYSGTGPNKKVAKQGAAESALADILSRTYGVTVGFGS